jgi:oligosaccharide repeat unit polymerase
MSVAGYISFLVLLVVVLFSMKKDVDIFSPARIFTITWTLVFGITEMKLSALQYEWSMTSWLLVLVGPLSVLLGIFIVYVINSDHEMLTIGQRRQKAKQIQINSRPLYLLIWLLLLLYFFSYSSTAIVKGFVPMFSAKGAILRTQFSLFGIGLFINTVPMIVFFSLLYMILCKPNIRKKIVLVSIVLITLISYAFLLQRFILLMTVVCCLVLLYYTTPKVNIRNMTVFLLVVVGIFYLVSTLRAGKLLNTYVYIMSKMRVPIGYAFITEPYMYIVMNLENFAHSIEMHEQFSYGYYTFEFFMAITGLKHLMSDYFSMNATPYLSNAFNTYTAFWTYYRDFGPVGLFLISLFGGYCVGSVYYAICRYPTLLGIAMYCVMVFILMLSFFVNYLGLLWFVFDVLLLLGGVYLITPHKRSVNLITPK